MLKLMLSNLPVASIALPGLGRPLGMLTAVGGKGFTDVDLVLEFPAFVAADVALVALRRLDQFTLAGHGTPPVCRDRTSVSDARSAHMEPRRSIIRVDIDGRRYTGDWLLRGKEVCVGSAYGWRNTPIGRAKPERVAARVLEELVKEWKERPN